MSQAENTHELNRPLSSDEQEGAIKIGAIQAAVALVFMGLATLLVNFDAIRLYPMSMSTSDVKDYAGRVEFAFRYQTLLVAWLAFNVLAIVYKRARTKALINPLNEQTETNVQAYKNNLTNSIEQTVVSVLAQLIFISFVASESVLKFIPLVNIIQFIGRVTFFIGYPLKRSFGFLCTMMPNIILVIFNIINFISFLFSH